MENMMRRCHRLEAGWLTSATPQASVLRRARIRCWTSVAADDKIEFFGLVKPLAYLDGLEMLLC